VTYECCKSGATPDCCGPLKPSTAAPPPPPPKFCSSWGDPHVETFDPAIVFHPHVAGTFTLFEHGPLKIETRQGMHPTNEIAYNFEVKIFVSGKQVYSTVAKEFVAGLRPPAIVDTSAVMVTTSTGWPSDRAPFWGFKDLLTFSDSSIPVKVHINGKHDFQHFIDVGIEYTGSLAEVTGQCDPRKPGQSTPVNEAAFCSNVQQCCASLRPASNPFANAAYRACMEDGLVTYECCKSGATPDCCGPLKPALDVFRPLGSCTVPFPACEVPPLACFGEKHVSSFNLTAICDEDDDGTPQSNCESARLSGITYNPHTETLFAVNNANKKVFEVDLVGKRLRWWRIDHLTADPEGIDWLCGSTFAIVNENPSSIITILLDPAETKATKLETVSTLVSPKPKDDLGFEGVAYLGSQIGYVALQEGLLAGTRKDGNEAPRVWNVKRTGAAPEDLYGDMANLTGLRTLTGAAHSCRSQTEFFALAKSPRGVYRLDLQTGKTKEQYAGDVCDMPAPEGLVFGRSKKLNSRFNAEDFMIVVGEPMEIRIWHADPSCKKNLNQTVGGGFQCLDGLSRAEITRQAAMDDKAVTAPIPPSQVKFSSAVFSSASRAALAWFMGYVAAALSLCL